VIRDAAGDDAESVCRIYNHYIRETIVTFEEQPVSPATMAERIENVAAAALPWLVAEREGVILGYAYASKWHTRAAYRHSTETTVYLASDAIAQGVGTKLYQVLLERLRSRGLHVAIGGIALPNAASIALHEKLGFRKVAHFSEVGFKFGKWIDVGYWQVLL
jgi:phosphinothricin acetyltransferase